MAAPMQFWGAVVKSKEPCQVSLGDATLIHISQITLGEIKKDIETVTVHVKVGDKKLVLGMLSNKIPQLSVDLVFDEDFEVSHNWKNGTVHLVGYQTEMEDTESYDEFSEEEDEPIQVVKEEGVKATAGKPKVDNKPKPEQEDESSDDDSSDDDDSEDADSDEMMGMDDSDEDSDEDDSEESEEEKPAKAANGVKRPNADSKTPQSKKTKIATPQKTDAKKGVVHPATPYPKKGGQTPAGKKSPNNSGGGKTPKSVGNNSTGPSKNKFKPGSGSQKKGKHGGK